MSLFPTLFWSSSIRKKRSAMRRRWSTGKPICRVKLRVEQLEDRTLLTARWLGDLASPNGLPALAAPVVEQDGSAAVVWDGGVHRAVAGQWVAGFTAISGTADEQVHSIQHELDTLLPAELGATVVRQLGIDGQVLIQVSTRVPENRIRVIANLDNVAYVEPNCSEGSVSVIPNDPDFSKLYGLRNTGQVVNGQTGIAGADVNATRAWDLTTGSYQIVVADIDTGMDYAHPDLRNNVWLNNGEIPTSRLQNLKRYVSNPSNPDDASKPITFADLNDSRNWGPFKITPHSDGAGHMVVDANDVLALMNRDASGNDLGTGGWAFPGNTKDGDTAHPNDYVGWNFVDNTNRPLDDNTHGTHTAGTIGAEGNNGVGVVGVNWIAQIMPLKWIAGSGSGNDADAIAAVNYSVLHGARVSSNSWHIFDENVGLYNAVKNARDHGDLFVAAAQNSSINNDTGGDFPAVFTRTTSAGPALDNVISVAATDNRDALASFSNYGLHTVQLGAPGVDVWSTFPTNSGSYAFDSGTSMATPHVAGAATLLWGYSPGSTYLDIKNAIMNGVDTIASLNGKTVTGGRLDVFKSLQLLGLTVTNVDPSGNIAGSVSNLQVTFSQAVQVASFTPDQVTLTGPGSIGIPVSVSVVAGSGDKQFNLSFDTQTTLSHYALTIGPHILDVTSREMHSAYSSTFTVQGLQVTASSPAGDIAPRVVDHVRLTFNEPVDPATLTPDQIVSFTGPAGPIDLGDATVTPVAGTNNTQVDITFDALSVVGKYELTIGPGIQDLSGHKMDQDGNFIDGEVPGDEYHALFNIVGPKITAASGIVPGNSYLPGALNTVMEQVTFNEPMDPATFTPDQVVIDGQRGSSYFADSVSVVAGSGNTTFNIQFTANATDKYTMVIGPNILDGFGNPMDQNGNFITGEIPGDKFTIPFNVVGPKITASQQIALGDTANGIYDRMRVTFNEGMNPAAFTPDLVRFTGPGNVLIPVIAVSPIAGTSNSQFDILFAPQGRLGNYTMVIGPNVLDYYGNAMDQNGNFITGEIPGDQYTQNFTVAGPKVTAATAIPGGGQEPIYTLRVTFSKPIDVSTFTPAKIASFSGPGGPLGIDGIYAVPGTNFTQFDIDFRAAPTTGTYRMVIGPDIRDAFGNKMDQNSNFVDGEIPQDQYTAMFSLQGLRITTPANGGTFLPGVDHVRLTFNEPVDASTFTPDTILSFTGLSGPITVTGVSAVPYTNSTQFDIFFGPQGTTGATYTLVVRPSVKDLYGNKLDQNGNLIPGEDPGDRFTYTFGVSGPRILSSTPAASGVVRPGLTTVHVTFNEPMDPATFTSAAVSFTGPGSTTIAVTAITPTNAGNTDFDITFAALTALGSYTMVIGPNVQDFYGNLMDQDGNLMPGEIPGDQNRLTFSVANVSVFDPDNYPNNAPLNNVFPGVTLTYLGDSTHGVKAVPTEAGSAGGARAFGSDDPYYAPEFYSPGYEMRIDFATPVSSVTIDAVATRQFSGLAGGKLSIFNASHVQIGTFSTANLAFGQLATMTLTRPTADIAYALASSNNFYYGVLLDDLSFTTPGPSSAAGTTPSPLGTVLPKITADSLIHGGSYVPGAASVVRVTFNEPMDLTTFSNDKVVINGPGGASDIANSVTPVAGSNNTMFDVAFSANTTGHYTLVIGPNILDMSGDAMDQNGNGIPAEIPGDQYAIAFNVLGPKITSGQQVAVGDAANSIYDRVRVTFNEAMDPASFTPDTVAFTGPANVTIPVTTITPVANTNDAQFDIQFSPQGKLGNYTMVIGPNVRDFYGNAMDQNGNFVTGEIPGDQFTYRFTINGPRALTEAVFDPDNYPDNALLNHAFPGVTLTYLGDSTHGVKAVPNPNPPGSGGGARVFGSDDPYYAPEFYTSGYEMRIDFATSVSSVSIDAIGTPNYSGLARGQLRIYNAAGTLIGTATTANLLAAGQVATMTLTRPSADIAYALASSDNYDYGVVLDDLHFSGSPTASLEPVNSLRVSFTKPIDASTFTPAKIASFSGPGGPIGIDGIYVVPGSNFTQFDIDFHPQTATGNYTMVLGPDIRDMYGNKLDQNSNLIDGEVPGDQFTTTFSIQGLRITTPANGGTFLPGVDHVRLTFNEPVDASSFTPDTILSFTGPGGPVTVTGVAAVPYTNYTQFDISFDPQGTTGAQYTMVIRPSVKDLYGNKLDQNGNLIPGEDPGDRYTYTFAISGPRILSSTPAVNGIVRPGAMTVHVTFNEAMDPSTFTPAAVSFSGPGGSIAVTSITATNDSNKDFDITFAAQTSLGSYTMVIGPIIQDFYGNLMDQNGNLIPGEIPGDQYRLTFSVANQVVFEPADYPDNAVLNTVFPGVTLSFLGNNTNSVVALPKPAGSAGGARVFGETTGGFYSPEFYNDSSSGGWWLRINFAAPVSSVSIDAIGTARFSGQARGLLRIFNSAGVQIGTFTTANLRGGELATMTLTRPTADIAFAYASSDQVNEGVLLDNLRFTSATAAPTPAAAAAAGRGTASGSGGSAAAPMTMPVVLLAPPGAGRVGADSAEPPPSDNAPLWPPQGSSQRDAGNSPRGVRRGYGSDPFDPFGEPSGGDGWWWI
jgi:subtilisin family serine protease